MRFGVAFSVALAASCVSTAAFANSAGVAGYTGKPTTFAPQGESCNQCHTGGTAPQVSITGPDTLTAGQSADYTLVVSTGQARAGGAVAATDGVTLTPSSGGGLRDSFGEMVQDGTKSVSGGQASFRFRVTAPATGTTLRLWAVGLAAGGGTNQSGDRATQITRDVTITGGGTAPTHDAGTSSSSGGDPSSSGGDPSGSGGASSSSGGTSSSGGSGTGTKGSTSGDGDDDPGSDDDGESSGLTGRRRQEMGDSGGSCSAAPGTGSSSLALALTSATAVALVLSTRRRGRRG